MESSSVTAEFTQLTPLQFLHAIVQSSPFFLQEHFIDEQVPLQLHLTTFNIHCGAGGDAVVMGYSFSSRKTQPQSVGSNFFPFHC